MSIVIIVLLGGDALRRCLRALAQQTGVEPPEIVVPFDDAHPDVDALGREFPNVRFIRVTGRHTYAELRTIGVRETKGEIVALLEDHCVPDPRWAAELVEAHRQEYAAVGGPVDKLTPDSAVNWSLYLADYVRYARPMPAGPVDHLTDCNVSYKRSAIDAIADVWRVEFHEPEVHAALQARGGTLWLSPGVLVQQQRPMTVRSAIWDRYAFGRLFGSRRVEGRPVSYRLTCAATSLALPALLVVRVAKNVFGKRRYVGDFIRTFPAVLLVCSTWALGEFIGYVTGKPAPALAAKAESVPVPQHSAA